MSELKSCKLDKSKIKRSEVVSLTCVHTPGGVNCAQIVEYLRTINSNHDAVRCYYFEPDFCPICGNHHQPERLNSEAPKGDAIV